MKPDFGWRYPPGVRNCDVSPPETQPDAGDLTRGEILSALDDTDAPVDEILRGLYRDYVGAAE